MEQKGRIERRSLLKKSKQSDHFVGDTQNLSVEDRVVMRYAHQWTTFPTGWSV
jgi:hypothetical protein